jgi:hypothetical protein
MSLDPIMSNYIKASTNLVDIIRIIKIAYRRFDTTQIFTEDIRTTIVDNINATVNQYR